MLSFPSYDCNPRISAIRRAVYLHYYRKGVRNESKMLALWYRWISQKGYREPKI